MSTGLRGEKMPRKCTVCHHGSVTQINSAIAAGQGCRDIAGRWEGLSKSSVYRHSRNCLQISLKVMVGEQRVHQAIDVHREFSEQLEAAKQLLEISREYLSDPDDPSQLFIGPQSHEIDVYYTDHNDCDGDGRPKKKKAKLNVLLAELAGREIEAPPVEMKTLDIRKFALDAIRTADLCLDKFARISGAYQKDKSNEQDTAGMIEVLTDRLIARGWERAAARNFAQEKYGAGAPIRMID